MNELKHLIVLSKVVLPLYEKKKKLKEEGSNIARVKFFMQLNNPLIIDFSRCQLRLVVVI